MNNWKFKRMPHDTFAGAFTVPREIFFNERNRLCLFPVREARHLLVKEDKDVVVAPDSVTVTAGKEPVVFEGKVDSVDILRDNECVEVFINGGEEVITVYELWGKCW
jgi:sucrose-6-phosphate hydrolase SacC (GH32 family)